MAIDAKPPGPFGYPTLLSQWVLFIQSGRYKNSRTAAASFVPHQYFSGAKIGSIFITSKLFGKNISSYIKTKRRRVLPASLMY